MFAFFNYYILFKIIIHNTSQINQSLLTELRFEKARSIIITRLK